MLFKLGVWRFLLYKEQIFRSGNHKKVWIIFIFLRFTNHFSVHRINTVNTVMESKKPLFIKIKEFYERLIDMEAYHEGDMMPSVREVGLSFNANPNTVQRAFTLMVEEGYLESLPKKGFFVKKVEADRFKALRESLKEILKQGYSKEDIKKELEGLENDCD